MGNYHGISDDIEDIMGHGGVVEVDIRTEIILNLSYN